MRRRFATVVAVSVALALTLGQPAGVANAKSPPPPRSISPTTIDAHLGYMPQKTCSPTAKPGTTALLKVLIATWGGGSSGISRGCSVGSTSEHKEGRALDWRMDVKYASQRKKVAEAMKWLTANNGEVAYRLGVMYIIWNQQIWSIYYPGLGWRKMANRGSYTANHKNHVHISLSWDGAMKQTSWWTGVPVTAPLNSKCGVKGARSCLPTIARTSAKWPTVKTEVPASFLPAPWTRPGIGGDPQVDRTLTAVPGTWVPAGAELAYQWTSDGRDIPGATESTLVVTSGLLGRSIRVRVTATTATGSISKTSDAPNDISAARFKTAPRPKITGKAATGQTVKVESGTWTPAPGSSTITWKRNGKAIKGAGGTGYQLTAADVGKKLSVTVTAKRAGYVTKSATSASVKIAKGKFAGVEAPNVTGEPVVGATLVAHPGVWTPKPTKFAYQWYVSGKKVKGATKAGFKLPKSAMGKPVLVRVAAKRSGYTTAYIRSMPVVPTS